MGAPLPFDPCLAALERAKPPGDRRIRVVEVLTTGTNGGAQEHLFALVTRMDPTRYDVSVVSLSAGSAVRKLQRAGVAVLVIDDPDDTIAVGALAAHLAEVRADVVHAHMYRAETVAARFTSWLAETSRPWLVVLDDLCAPADAEGLWPGGPAGRVGDDGPLEHRPAAGAEAARHAKRLVLDRPDGEETARRIAERRTSDEGQRLLRAFLDRPR